MMTFTFSLIGSGFRAEVAPRRPISIGWISISRLRSTRLSIVQTPGSVSVSRAFSTR